jgi:hypothetical protein
MLKVIALVVNIPDNCDAEYVAEYISSAAEEMRFARRENDPIRLSDTLVVKSVVLSDADAEKINL